MRPQTILVMILALVFGGSAAVGINSLRPKADTVPVLVAAVDIPPFAVITPDMVKTTDWPRALVPADMITNVEDALDRAAISPIIKGETMFGAKLAPRGAGRGMAAKVPPGMRAFTIITPTVEAGVAGFILPGNKVDVLITLEGRGGEKDLSGGGSTATLLQNVEILAVEQRVTAPAESKVDPSQIKSVTLLVSPQETERLALGQAKGKLCLTLRSHNDLDRALTKAVHVNELLGELPPRPEPKPEIKPVAAVVTVAPPPPPPPPLNIRTIRGTQRGIEITPGGPGS